MSDGPRFLDDPTEAVSRPSAQPAPTDERGWVDGAVTVQEVFQHSPVELIPPSSDKTVRSGLVVGATALVILLGGVAALELVNFLIGQFTHSIWLGSLSIAAVVPAACVLVWSIVREWRGYTALAETDALRSGLASQDLATVRSCANRWLSMIGESSDTRRSVEAASDVATIREILKAGPLARIDQEATQAARSAAFQVLIATAVSPWPAADGVIVIWRSLRLVREIAQKYGLRPGTFGSLRLFQRLTLDAGSVAGTEVAVTMLSESLLNSSALGGLMGQATGSAVAARRILRLALAVARASRPL